MAIQHIMNYAFSLKSITAAEDLEALYPITKEYITSNVFLWLNVETSCSCSYGRANE